jgi:beta-barrel assembly-enhancing protease
MIGKTLCRSLLAAALFVQGLVPLRADNINLPDLGDSSAAAISPAEEKRLGENFMRRARQSLAMSDDPELNGYVQALGQRLLAQTETSYREFRFFMVNDSSINAFAVPGGFVGIHKGLLLATQNEAELASVMAHEITHVTQKHIPRLIAESQRTTLPAMAAILASILLASAGHGSGAHAGIVATQAAMAQHGINFTRSFEEEADRLGMATLARAGFDPNGMPSFFERLQMLNRHNDTSLPEFLRTHPVTTNRIADARNRAERLPKNTSRDSDDYLHVHAKLRAAERGSDAEIARGFRANLEQGKYRDVQAERYGYALALLRNREFPAARAETQKLVEQRPQRVYYRILQAEIEMAANQPKQALAIYEQTAKNAPNHPGLLRHHAEALLKNGQAQRAQELLKAAVRHTTDDPTLYRLLAQAAGAANNPLDAHKAAAEQYYLNGNPQGAIEQLRLALKHTGDNFYQVSSIEARIAAIRDEIAMFEAKK